MRQRFACRTLPSRPILAPRTEVKIVVRSTSSSRPSCHHPGRLARFLAIPPDGVVDSKARADSLRRTIFYSARRGNPEMSDGGRDQHALKHRIVRGSNNCRPKTERSPASLPIRKAEMNQPTLMTSTVTECVLRRTLIIVALAGLALGAPAWGLGRTELAYWIWAPGTVPVIVGLLISMSIGPRFPCRRPGRGCAPARSSLSNHCDSVGSAAIGILAALPTNMALAGARDLPLRPQPTLP